MDGLVQAYTEAFKTRMIGRMVGPAARSANALAAEVGVAQATLSRWLAAARNVSAMTRASKQEPTPGKPGRKQWTGAEKLRVVREARGLSDAALGALLRREGLHAAQLAAWQAAAEAAAEAALAEPSRARRGRAAPSAEAQRIAVLERELRRKEKALAETAALLVLKKKAEAWWADADDTTPEPSDS